MLVSDDFYSMVSTLTINAPSKQALTNLLVGHIDLLLSPANTPKSVAQKINQTMMFILAQERFRKAILERGSDPASGSAEEFAAFLRLDQSKWAKLIKENKIAVQ
jgi:tripartite-type tricarboxylate transporter receptor subunit TctC